MRFAPTLSLGCLMAFGISACDSSAELPSRQDCIVMIAPGDESNLASVSPDPDMLIQRSRDLRIPVGGTAYSGEGHIYLQFSAECEAREALARKLMHAVFGAVSQDFSYRSTGIVPGTDTIDVMGDSWSEKRGEPFGPGKGSTAIPVALSEIRSEHGPREVRVRGYIQSDLFGATYLYPDGNAAASGIHDPGLDVVLGDRLQRAGVGDLERGFCAIVEGRFEPRSPDRLYLGSWFSKVGSIRAREIHRSPC